MWMHANKPLLYKLMYLFSQLPQNPIYNWKPEIYSTNHLINTSITSPSCHDDLFLLYDQLMIMTQACSIRFSLLFRPGKIPICLWASESNRLLRVNTCHRINDGKNLGRCVIYIPKL